MKLSKDDKFYEIKLSTSNAEKNESVEAAEIFEKKKLKDKRKKELVMIISKDKKKHIETIKLKA